MTNSLQNGQRELFISTWAPEDPLREAVTAELQNKMNNPKIIFTYGMKISHCIGCNDCWIKTPGLCCIKDDYEQVLLSILQAERVIFLTDTKLGFVCSQMKHMIDRILPLATMHLYFKNGQMRHYSRYGRMLDMGLLYRGEAQRDFLNQWLERVQINLHGKSLGAYPVEEREGLYHALGHH